MSPRERLVHEANRLLERYHVEVVDRFGLCPWAKHVRSSNRTVTHVVLDDPCRPEEAAKMVSPQSPDIDVAFLVAPLFEKGSGDFADWCEAVSAHLGGRFLAAPFFPHIGPGTGSVHFFRQTPDPTLQLVRRAVVEQVRAQDPPHYRDIFELRIADLHTQRSPKSVSASVIEHNERVLAATGRATIQAIFDEIRADRDRAYAELLRPPGQPQSSLRS